ncbi:MAG: hypothetical protein ACI81W_001992, partial [Saprospiraceae bacterium]
PGEIFADIFIFYKKILREVLWVALFAGLAFCTFSFFTSEEEIAGLFSHPSYLFGAITVLSQYFLNEALPFLPIANILIFTLVAFIPLTLLIKQPDATKFADKKWTFYISNYLKLLIPVAMISLMMMTGDWYTFLLFVFLAPILFLWMFINYYEEVNIFRGLGRTFSLISGNYGSLISLSVLLVLIGILFYGFIDTVLVWLFFDMIGWNLSLEQSAMDQFLSMLLAFISIFFMSLIYVIMCIGGGLIYFTILEIEEAPSLKERIKNIGIRKRIQGIEAEG